MKKITILFVLIGLSAFSQKNSKVTISGKILEANSNLPLEYATLILTSVKTNKVTGGVTDINGKFSIDVPKGPYKMKVEFIGFKTKQLPQKTLTANTSLGTIFLKEDAETLDEVEIIAEKSTVEIRLDKKIYNVGKDMTIKGGNASDVLDNVPSVNVDAEGAVSLRGNENVRILIDGKPSALVGLNGTDALRNLPADAIEKVEVITSPSARYDAEGTAGILNIILRKGKVTGFNGALNLSVGNPDLFQTSGSLNYRTKKLNIFTNLGFSHRNGPGNSFSDFTNLENGVITDFRTEDRTFQRKNNNYNGSIGLEYYLNKNSSITGTFFYRDNNGDDIATNVTDFLDVNRFRIDQITRIENESEDGINKQFSLNYSNNLDDKGQKLTIDFQHSDNNEDEFSSITDNNTLSELNSQFTSSTNTLFQADYVLPIGEKHQLELGHKSEFQDLNSDFRVRDANGLPLDPDPSNNINFKQNIYAHYAQFGSKFDKFSYLLGLRVETTEIDLLLINTNEESEKNFTQVFPTVNLGYELNETDNLTLGYSRRLRRPRFWFLNPFETRSSATAVFKGNPDLTPTFTNSYDLGYTTRLGKLTLNSSVYYQRSTDLIQRVSIIEEREINGQPTNVFVRQPFNLNNEDRYGFELTTNYNPFKWMRLSSTFNYFKFKTNEFTFTSTATDGTDVTTLLPEVNNDSWFVRFNSRITLPAKIQWQTRVRYRGPQENAQGTRDGVFVANLAFSKDLFKEKATLVLNVNDLLNDRVRRSQTFNPSQENPSTIADQEFQWRERQITLSFTYRFNQKKKRERPQRDYDGGGGEAF
ncbi:outer membrane beta-barrel family protein [uncultured Tenacibaculum sp.]|uniref:outer membrane beta-barrel family protein n=1 Tax=uncultured Tenacibaculum sp. TaxID=174713 RepID=UPI002624E8A8|nr:outer membrane beta-barrel family protein [uncultured Tenacibaculum sp.]